MQTTEEALEKMLGALATVPPPDGMNRRILMRCAYWLDIQDRPTNVDDIPKN